MTAASHRNRPLGTPSRRRRAARVPPATGSSTGPRPTRCRSPWRARGPITTSPSRGSRTSRRCTSPAPSTSRCPDRRRQEILQLISRINEQLWVGHFDLWSSENVVMFRHALLLAGGADPTHGQCETMLRVSVEACERYFQAFQFVIWAGKYAPARPSTASCSRPKARPDRRAARQGRSGDGIDRGPALPFRPGSPCRRTLSTSLLPRPRRRGQDGRRHAGGLARRRHATRRASPSSTRAPRRR